VLIYVHASKAHYDKVKDKDFLDNAIKCISIIKLKKDDIVSYDGNLQKDLTSAMDVLKQGHAEKDIKACGDKIAQVIKNTKNVSIPYLINATFYQHVKKDMKKAFENYEKALELERKNNFMTDSQARDIVETLMLEYVSGGDPKKSAEMTMFGITQFPDYPYFDYFIAVMSASNGMPDMAYKGLDNFVEKYRTFYGDSNGLDPETDEAFNAMREDPEFKKFMIKYKEYKSAHEKEKQEREKKDKEMLDKLKK
jgi:hypothetical protein